MELINLIQDQIELHKHKYSSTDVTGIYNDARKVTANSVFIAIKGNKLDGHTFIPQAIAQGAIMLVVEDRQHVPVDFEGIVYFVKDTRETQDLLAAKFYRNPGNEMFCIGVTGTNGKTSTSYMIECLLNQNGLPTGVIGTVNHHLLDQVWPTDMTTPDSVGLQKRLRDFRDAGAKAVVMEVSSHALDQKRVHSVPFDTVVFTNLTRDHLDYHKSMELYFQAKEKLFTEVMWKSNKAHTTAVVNIADPYGRKIKIAEPVHVWTYGTDESDFQVEIIDMSFTQTEFLLKTPEAEVHFRLPMSGQHNVQNAIAAIAVALSAGVRLEDCAHSLQSFKGVPGRLQSVPNEKDISVFVDYAHSPDAIENVLLSLIEVRKSFQSKAKIWTIFGCGGDRDKGKRPLMAQAAFKYSDEVMVTSDNPRSEDPQQIIHDILIGVSDEQKKRLQVEVDRRIAIEQVIRQAKKGDVILIAGKGHEAYQIIGQEVLPFCDYQVALEILKN